MSKFTKELIDELAEKQLISLNEDENALCLNEFEEIDYSINLINQIDSLETIEPMSHCLDDFTYELREDVDVDSWPVEEIFSNCDSMKIDEVKVPKVVN